MAKQVYTEQQFKEACELRQAGLTLPQISEKTGIKKPSLKKLFIERKVVLSEEQYNINTTGARWKDHEPIVDNKKKCGKCNEFKELTDFNLDNNRITGLTNHCKFCQHNYYMENQVEKLEKARIYRENNPDKMKQRDDLYYEENSDQIIKRVTAWRHKNPMKCKDYSRKWRKANQKHKNFRTATYRATKSNATPCWLTDEQLNKMEEFYKNCPKGYSVDHIEPLRAELSCGLHVPWNLQYLPELANESKANSPEINITKIGTCHQKSIKDRFLQEDINNGHQTNLKVSEFSLTQEEFTQEHRKFIERYEWLGTIGTQPKWIFCARYNGSLGSVVMIGEPVAYSQLGPQCEALIQRGATASWTPKNLGSRIVMFACRWMVKNTSKRLFIGYSDPEANEIGTIYQACNFDYVGGWYGSKKNFILPNGKSVSSRYFTKTSSMRKWAKQLNIKLMPEWFVVDRLKLKLIPINIKELLLNHANEQKFQCDISIPKPKGKYYLLLAANKQEKKQLNKLRYWDSLPYPKRNN